MHEHKFQGQALRHEHPGGQLPHGYFGHAEDGSRQPRRDIPHEAVRVLEAQYRTTAQRELTALRASADQALRYLDAGSDPGEAMTHHALRADDALTALTILWRLRQEGEAAECHGPVETRP